MKKHLTPIFILLLALFGVAFSNQIAGAADLSKFNAGNIMSDHVMSNKNSMTEAQIQQFLTNKNPCNDRNISKASQYPNMKYNIKDGKFVCLSNEVFNGETAAKIIWQAGQDYNINPQALIVLLQKEQGLVTDTWPNHNIQYRSATGYGCPDNAPCEEKYYGFKNQVRNAANFFRAHLDNRSGWYKPHVPGGQNVKWSPAACGAGWVNIENRATSGLYSYTPYQPNRAALNAGYGSGDGCSSYGNRNFWAYFNDWFGSTQGDNYSGMDKPRKLIANKRTDKINPLTKMAIPAQYINNRQVVMYTSRTNTSDNKLCLRTESNTNTNSNMCVLYEDLDEGPSFYPLSKSISLYAKHATSKVDPIDNSSIPNQTIPSKTLIEYSSKTMTIDNKECMRTKANTDSNWNMCVLRENLQEEPVFTNLSTPITLVTKINTPKVDPMTGGAIPGQIVPKGLRVTYSSSITTLADNKECMRTKANTDSNWNMCVLRENLQEEPVFTNLSTPITLVTKINTPKVDPMTGGVIPGQIIPKGLKVIYSSSITTLGSDKECMRTKANTDSNWNMCVLRENLQEK